MKKPPFYYVAMNTLRAYEQANSTQYKKRKLQLNSKKKNELLIKRLSAAISKLESDDPPS